MNNRNILFSAKTSLVNIGILFVFMFAIFGVAAFGKGKTTIDSQRWALVQINGKRVSQTNAYIEFNSAEKRFAGNAGCNRMFGNLEMNGDKIKLSDIGATKMFCTKARVMKQESDFIKLLEQSVRYKQQRNTLNLYVKNRIVLKFVREDKNNSSGNENSNPGNSSATLEEKKWVLAAIEEKPLPKLETVPFIVFDKAQAHIGGNSGCNNFSGKYKIEGGKIVLNKVISTLRACFEEPGKIDGQFWEHLTNASHFKIEANKLNFYASEKVLLTFNAQEKK